MAYLCKDLSVLAYANGFTLWHYRTADTAAEVTSPGYFDRDLLRAGDFIFANTGAVGSGRAPGMLLLVVGPVTDDGVTVGTLTPAPTSRCAPPPRCRGDRHG